MIYYGCSRCGAPMGSPDSLAGQTDACPVCGNAATVPNSPPGDAAGVQSSLVTPIRRAPRRPRYRTVFMFTCVCLFAPGTICLVLGQLGAFIGLDRDTLSALGLTLLVIAIFCPPICAPLIIATVRRSTAYNAIAFIWGLTVLLPVICLLTGAFAAILPSGILAWIVAMTWALAGKRGG